MVMTPINRDDAMNVVCEKCGHVFPLSRALEARFRESVDVRVSTELAQASERIRADERRRTTAERDLVVADLRRERDEALAGRKEAERAELEMRSRERAVEQHEKNVKRDVARHRQEVKAEAAAELQADHEAEMRELQQLNERLRADLAKASRRAIPGSPLERGFIHQDVIGEEFRRSFPTDHIEVTPRGQAGADVRQYVGGRIGGSAGLLLTEVKWAQRWDSTWMPKLRTNLRASGAKVGLLISVAPPPEGPGVRPIGDSLWYADHETAEMAIVMLRESILALAHRDAVHARHADTHGQVYEYLTSDAGGIDDLRQFIEGLAGDAKSLRDEQTAMGRTWKLREEGLRKCSVAMGRFVAGLEAAGAVLPNDLRFRLPGCDGQGQAPAVGAAETPALEMRSGVAHRTCRGCGKALEAPSRRGRPPVLCSDCRAA